MYDNNGTFCHFRFVDHERNLEDNDAITSEDVGECLPSKEGDPKTVENINENICSIVPSNKKGLQLLVTGYIFTKNKIVKNIYYWECSKRQHRKRSALHDQVNCKSKATTKVLENGQHKLKSVTDHNHCAVAIESLTKARRLEIKAKASSIRNKPSQILQDVNAKTRIIDAPELPSTNAWRQVINRERKQNCLKEPSSLIEINIPESLKKTISGELFLLKETNVGDDKILLFSTRQKIEWLSKSFYWISDGTFDTVPEIFLQLYSRSSGCYKCYNRSARVCFNDKKKRGVLPAVDSRFM